MKVKKKIICTLKIFFIMIQVCQKKNKMFVRKYKLLSSSSQYLISLACSFCLDNSLMPS